MVCSDQQYEHPRQTHPSLTTELPSVLASLGICIALLVLTPNKQSATWVFTNVTDGSGWGSKGFSFLLGHVLYSEPCKPSADKINSFLSVAWTMVGLLTPCISYLMS